MPISEIMTLVNSNPTTPLNELIENIINSSLIEIGTTYDYGVSLQELTETSISIQYSTAGISRFSYQVIEFY